MKNQTAILTNPLLTDIEKRKRVEQLILREDFSLSELAFQDDKEKTIVMEALESISQKEGGKADISWLTFAGENISAKSNNLKREACRVVGNIAKYFPDNIEDLIPVLLPLLKDSGTVIRWSAAYALGRIITIDWYAKGELYFKLCDLAALEENNGVKKQLLKGLKTAERLRNKVE